MEQTRDVLKHHSGVVLTGASFRCTGCDKDKPGSMFGLRKMRDGTIRNQAQCMTCRARPKAKTKKKATRRRK